MKPKTFIFIIITVSILQFSFHSKTEEKWKLVKSKDGITAYTRNIEGSDIKQVKVKTSFKSNLSALVTLIKNVSTHEAWIYKCFKAETIKTISETEYFYYNESEAPWPISNRDIITHAVITQDKKTKTVTIISTGKPNYLKEITGIVRIKKLKAKWDFVPKNDGTIDLTFFISIDLGGGLPAWVVNMAIADGPFETVSNLRKEAQKEKYQKIKLNFIDEL